MDKISVDNEYRISKESRTSSTFPVELPYRLIQLYTYTGDIVLNPFMGSGSTAIAALQSNRIYVGYDISAEHVKLAEKRIALYQMQKRQMSIEF